MSLETGFNLLEKSGCNHVGAITEASLSIDGSSHEGLSQASQDGARRVAQEYEVGFGFEAAL